MPRWFLALLLTLLLAATVSSQERVCSKSYVKKYITVCEHAPPIGKQVGPPCDYLPIRCCKQGCTDDDIKVCCRDNDEDSNN